GSPARGSDWATSSSPARVGRSSSISWRAESAVCQDGKIRASRSGEGRARLSVTELGLEQARVEPAPLEQLLVRALLDEPPAVENEDRVGLQNRRETVRDHDAGAASHDPLERGLNERL